MENLNYIVLVIFAPVLILIGTMGFLIPSDTALTSGQPAYNIFHIIFGIIGLVIVYLDHELYIRAFNIGFGVIDLYQAIASRLSLFPKKYFQWTAVDDALHIVIGAALVLVGVFG